MSLRQLRNLLQKKSDLRGLIDSGTDFLERHKVEQPRKNAEILLAHILKKPVHYIYSSRGETLSADRIKTYAGMLGKRAACIPLQYITEEVDFFGYRFFVKKGVFIPRPETEILVEKTIGLYRKHFKPDCVKMLDIGTGCGNIAVTLAKEIKNCSVVATDVSLNALKVSSCNAVLHKVKGKIKFKRENLFPAGKNKFHIIVSNPPYIPRDDISVLDEEVKKEPLRALDGGADGTTVMKGILKRADAFLYDGGFLVMEIGYGQADFIRNAACGMNLLRIEKDLAGIERVAIFRKC